jgi:hypothetical protein
MRKKKLAPKVQKGNQIKKVTEEIDASDISFQTAK